jgi:hypothetical protein
METTRTFKEALTVADQMRLYLDDPENFPDKVELYLEDLPILALEYRRQKDENARLLAQLNAQIREQETQKAHYQWLDEKIKAK